MQNELTESQINFYQENGFLAIENFLNADELEEWRRCTDESVEERLGNSVEFYDEPRWMPNSFTLAFLRSVSA